MHRITIIMVMLFIPSILDAQPSSSIDFVFRMHDSQGKEIDISTFCREWKILGWTDHAYSPCETQGYNPVYYFDSCRLTRINITTIFPPYIIKFVHKGKSMILYFPNRRGVYMPDFRFREGTFLIENECDDQIQQTLPCSLYEGMCIITRFNWGKAKKLYKRSPYYKRSI